MNIENYFIRVSLLIPTSFHRALTERKVLGLPPIVPLSLERLENDDLGPGYDIGYYAGDQDDLRRRPDNCRITDAGSLRDMRNQIGRVRARMNTNGVSGINLFRQWLDDEDMFFYHSWGHIEVGECGYRGRLASAMCCATYSARDPSFYRWHRHISDLRWEAANQLLPR